MERLNAKLVRRDNTIDSYGTEMENLNGIIAQGEVRKQEDAERIHNLKDQLNKVKNDFLLARLTMCSINKQIAVNEPDQHADDMPSSEENRQRTRQLQVVSPTACYPCSHFDQTTSEC